VKALLVTSRVTFTPDNYDELVVGLADCPEIGGLLILDNKSRDLSVKGLGLIGLGAFGMGSNMLWNQFGGSHARRTAAYEKQNKPVWILKTVNCAEALAIVKDNGFDLVVNARTRCIYKKTFLSAPRLGCINIHHGLLPLQRGTSCDMWNLSEGKATGFSIHNMAEKIDAGAIIRAVQVSDGSEKSYTNYLRNAVTRELAEIKSVLKAVASDETILQGQPNIGPADLKHRRTPSWREIRNIRKSGLSL
jgi:methionyl-tRNA formyltransferase